MKKRILALVGAVVLTLSMTMTAFATPSTEAGDGETSDANVIVVNGISDKYNSALSEFDFDKLIEGTEYADTDWSKVKDVEVVEVGEGEVEYPVTIKFDKDDYAGKPLIFAYIDGAWVILSVADGGDTWNITVNGETALRIYDVKKAASGSEIPKTGDTTSYAWFAVALAAAATAVVASKKRNA